MFRDECEIQVAAGKGGDGLVSFRREKYTPKGGPNGGCGGDGGSVILVASPSVTSLLSLGRKPRYVARSGEPGGPVDRHGANADDLVLEVPIGTQIYDRKRGNLLRDLALSGESLVLAAGGRGGRGNASFATAINQSPRHAEKGRPGEERDVSLQLKLVAEVGLLGLPNAGKSTFLRSITKATPKIADYPFTTLEPQVGIAQVGTFDTLVVADLPGLIEGAAEGAGLGHRFLRHVERCRVLLHLVDVSEGATTEPLEAYRIVTAELAHYSSELARRPRLVVATKVEDESARERAAELEARVAAAVPGVAGFLCISSATGSGVDELLVAANALARAVRA